MYYVDTAVLKAANIPEPINWNIGEWKFYLSYTGQVKTCRKCDEEGYYAKSCENTINKDRNGDVTVSEPEM